jgi:hypothetical protein
MGIPARFLALVTGLAVALCVGTSLLLGAGNDRNDRPEKQLALVDSLNEPAPVPQAVPIAAGVLERSLTPALAPPIKDVPQPAPVGEAAAKQTMADKQVEKKPSIKVTAADPPAVVPTIPVRVTFKRRQKLDAEGLRKQLMGMPELHVDRVRGTSSNLLAMLSLHDRAQLLASRTDLAGLPMQMGPDCLLGKEPAENLQVLSRKLRIVLEASIPKDGIDIRPERTLLKELLTKWKQVDPGKVAGKGRTLEPRLQDWLTPAAVPVLMQLLQAENTPVRMVLVDVLGKIPGKVASEALANRALMDLSPEVRELAIKELKSRPVEEHATALLQGLRYPWPAVVDHAAEALVALKVDSAVEPVIRMLSEHDPALPVTVGRGPSAHPAIREVVRINHLGNCVLCHAPSTTSADLVRGAVPTAGEALPAPSSTPQYYERGSTFVRADITYLRQDFSVVQPVENHGPWPSNQRFDYLVRYRPLSEKDVAVVHRQVSERKKSPHREAMLFVLGELTGKDLGTTAADWTPLLPPEKNP